MPGRSNLQRDHILRVMASPLVLKKNGDMLILDYAQPDEDTSGIRLSSDLFNYTLTYHNIGSLFPIYLHSREVVPKVEADLVGRFQHIAGAVWFRENRTNLTPSDKLYRVYVDPDGDVVEVTSLDFFGVDGCVWRQYGSVDELPEWMQGRLAVLSMLKPDKASHVANVGVRVSSTVFWVQEPSEDENDARKNSQEATDQAPQGS